nr:hypothetical protein [Tanacetum cinerariifolium]
MTNCRDLRDLEIATQGRRIRELERLLAHARLDDFRDADRDEEESEGSDIDSTESNDEEDENRWGVHRPNIDRHYRPGHYNSSQNLGVKVDVPNFEGKSHPYDFIDWLYTVERMFDIKNLSDEQKYHNFKQSGGMLVDEFTSGFDRLRLCYDVVEEEEETIARYLALIKPKISNVVQLQQYWSYNDVCRKALKFLETIEPHIKLTTEHEHIDYLFSGFEDDDINSISVSDDEDDKDDSDAYSDTPKDDRDELNNESHTNVIKNEGRHLY